MPRHGNADLGLYSRQAGRMRLPFPNKAINLSALATRTECSLTYTSVTQHRVD